MSSRRTEHTLMSSSTMIHEKIKGKNGETTTRKWIKGGFLGKGGFAKVYELTDAESRKVYASKIIPKESLLKKRAKQKLISEIKIHKSVNHDYVVGFEHYFEDSKNVYILLELCPNQSMNELLKRRKRLHEIEVRYYEVDVWSLGVIIYTLIVGKPPFETTNVKATYDRIRKNSYHFPSHISISKEAKELIQWILHSNPNRRPTLEDIKNHSF